MAAPMKLALVLSAIDKATAVINDVVNKATAKLNQLQEKTNKMSKNAMDFGKSAVGMGVAAGASLAPAVMAFASAEEAMTRLKVTMMDSSGQVSKDFKGINDLATELGGKLPGNTADFQNMMAKLVQQGISTKAILGGVGKAAAYIGVQMKMPFEQAAEFAAKMQDATKTTEGDMLDLMDVIQKAYYLGVDSSNMQQGFSKLAAGMDMIKMRGLEGAKAMAPLLVMADQAAMAGEAAGNAYRKVFQASFNTGKIEKANKILAGEGIKGLSFTDKKGEFAGIQNMFSQLEKLKMLSTEKRVGVIKTIFGDDAETLQVVSLLMEKGFAGYKDTMKKMDDQASLDKRVEEQLGTLTLAWEAAMGSMTNMLAAFGSQIAPALKDFAAWIGKVTQQLNEWISANPELAATLGKVVMVFAGLAMALGTVGLLMGGGLKIVSLMVTGFNALTSVLGFVGKAVFFVSKAIMWMGRVMMMNPIGLIITAIAAAAALIWYYWDEIVAFFKWLWDTVKQLFWDFWEWVKGWAVYFYDTGAEIVTNLWEGMKSVWLSMTRWIKDSLYAIPIIGDMMKGSDPMELAIQKMEADSTTMDKLAAGDVGMTTLVRNLQVQGYNVDKFAAAIPQSGAAVPQSAAATAKSTGTTVNYQPTITLQGDVSSATHENFKKMLNDNKNDITRIVDEQNKRNEKKALK